MNSVLVLDDDDNYRELVLATLEDHCGVQSVVGFASGDALLRHFASGGQWPDLVLVDYHMPDMHGLEVLQHLRARGIDVAVALISGGADGSERNACLTAGAVAFLEKPVSFAQLAAQLQELVAGHGKR
jgi:CheY-like chemotaxis protein